MTDLLKRALCEEPGDPHVADAALAAYLDGTMPQPARADLERHLGRCPRCSQDLAACIRVETEAGLAEESVRNDPAEALSDRSAPFSSQATQEYGSRRRPQPARRGATSNRGPRRQRTWLRIAAGITLLLGALFLGRETGRWLASGLEPTLLARLQDWTDRDVGAGATRLLVASGPGLELSNVSIADDPQFSSATFASARRVSMRVAPGALLRGRLNGAVDLDRPRLRLVRNSAGRWNIETLGGKSPRGNSLRRSDLSAEIDRALEEATQGLPPRGAAKDPRVQLTSATIRDGVVELDDLGTPGDALRIDHLNLAYRGTRGDRATLSLSGRIGENDDRLVLRGVVGPFEGDVLPVYRFPEVEIQGLPVDEIPGAPRGIEGQLSFAGNLESAGRSLADIVAEARGAGSLKLCCGAFEGRNLARDLVTQISAFPGGKQALVDALKQPAVAVVLNAGTTPYERLDGIARLDPGVLHITRFDLSTALFEATAEASLSLDGTLTSQGSVRVSPELGNLLLASAPWLESLSDASGSLRIPFRASGSWPKLDLSIDATEVIAAIERQMPVPSFWRPLDLDGDRRALRRSLSSRPG